MNRVYNLLFVVFLCLYGCATLINGSTQEVPIDVPKGTRITDNNGEIIPLISSRQGGGNGKYIILKRKRDYILRFSYKGEEISASFKSSLEGWWIIPDYFTFYGLIVDAITGAWHSFDGITVRFPNDSSKNRYSTKSYLEVYDPSTPKIGIMLIANTGLVLPFGNGEIDFGFFNCYRFGAGYDITNRITLLASYGAGNLIDIMPRHTDYVAFGQYSSADLEARIRIQNNIYLTGGGGWTHITSDTLKKKAYGYDSFGRRIDLSDITAPTNVSMPTIFAGIGLSGSAGFFELRHTFGLSKINLSNGEIGKFGTTSITFGFNLKF